MFKHILESTAPVKHSPHSRVTVKDQKLPLKPNKWLITAIKKAA